MPKIHRTFVVVTSASADANTRSGDPRRLVLGVGFDERVKGAPHVFSREGVKEIINLQPLRGGKAKPCQVGKVRTPFALHHLAPAAEEDE